MRQPVRRDHCGKPLLQPVQRHRRIGIGHRRGNFCLLYRVHQAVPQALVQHPHQPGMQVGVGKVGAQLLGITQCARRVQPLDQVPGRQVIENTVGHFTTGRAQMAKSQQRHQQVQTEPTVKISTAHMHPGCGQYIATAIGVTPPLRPQSHHGEV